MFPQFNYVFPPPFYPQPEWRMPLQPVVPSATPQKYQRFWNKARVQRLSEFCHTYCQTHRLRSEDLTTADFSEIAVSLGRTVEQCLYKFQEIRTVGSLKAGVWNIEEDEMLKELIEETTLKWGAIAKAINERIHHGLAIRSGKKCKERWMNHLNPSINRGPWTIQEDLVILLGHQKHGNRWSLIGREVEHRTESAIKNRIKSLLNQEKQNIQFSCGQEVLERAIQRVQHKTSL